MDMDRFTNPQNIWPAISQTSHVASDEIQARHFMNLLNEEKLKEEEMLSQEGNLKASQMTSSNAYDSCGAGSSDYLNGLRILLVEDSPDVGKAVKSLLELLGADVAGPAVSAAEAERLLSVHSPDVALVDFHLRGGELAYDLIAWLHDQGVPVIVVSGSEMPELPLVEAAGILEKPFSAGQLLL